MRISVLNEMSGLYVVYWVGNGLPMLQRRRIGWLEMYRVDGFADHGALVIAEHVSFDVAQRKADHGADGIADAESIGPSKRVAERVADDVTQRFAISGTHGNGMWGRTGS